MMNVAWELKVVVLVVVSDVASLFSQLLCFLWIGKQTFKNEFVIWKDSCDQDSLNRIQDVIFELHYPHQGGKKRGKINKEESESEEETEKCRERSKRRRRNANEERRRMELRLSIHRNGFIILN